ncbi:MAG TPA: hypothetical protein VIH90_03325 [Candidatus Saccharimonadales bacterium]
MQTSLDQLPQITIDNLIGHYFDRFDIDHSVVTDYFESREDRHTQTLEGCGIHFSGFGANDGMGNIIVSAVIENPSDLENIEPNAPKNTKVVIYMGSLLRSKTDIPKVISESLSLVANNPGDSRVRFITDGETVTTPIFTDQERLKRFKLLGISTVAITACLGLAWEVDKTLLNSISKQTGSSMFILQAMTVLYIHNRYISRLDGRQPAGRKTKDELETSPITIAGSELDFDLMPMSTIRTARRNKFKRVIFRNVEGGNKRPNREHLKAVYGQRQRLSR